MIPLTQTPNEVRQILDDTDAQALLVELGLLDKLREFSRRAGLTGAHSDAIYYDGHPTHWIAAIHFTGYSNPADNGYVVRGFPKSTYSGEQFRAMFAGDAKAVPPDFVEGGRLRTPPN